MIDPHIFLHLIEHVKVASSSGHQLIGWSVDTLDWDGKSVSQILSNVRKEVSWLYNPAALCKREKGNLKNTVEALPQIITFLKQKGYSLVTVPELISAKKP